MQHSWLGYRKVVILACMLLGYAVQSGAQSLSIYTEIAPPYQVKMLNGAMGGPAVDVVREIQRRVNNTDPIKEVPWARGYRELESTSNTVLFMVSRTAERDPLFQWVGPLTETAYALYVRADSPVVLHTLDEAKRLKSIGVYRNDARDQMLTAAGFTNLDRTTENTANVKKLMADRIDAFAASSGGIDDLMAAAGVPRDRVREGVVFRTIQLWLAFSKETPSSVITAWSGAFDAMKKDKTLDKIMKAGAPNWTPPKKAVTEF